MTGTTRRLRRFVRSTLLRRVLALVCMACLASSWCEALLPDVHDGDAAAAEVANSDAASHGRADAAFPVYAEALAVVPAALIVHGTVVATIGESGTEAPGSHDPSTPGSHKLHVDHCGHAHSMPPAAAGAAPPPAPEHADGPPATVAALTSVALSPHTRPPIA